MEEDTKALEMITAEVDLLCDECMHEITIGEDYAYDHEEEKIICLSCIERK